MEVKAAFIAKAHRCPAGPARKREVAETARVDYLAGRGANAGGTVGVVALAGSASGAAASGGASEGGERGGVVGCEVGEELTAAAAVAEGEHGAGLGAAAGRLVVLVGADGAVRAHHLADPPRAVAHNLGAEAHEEPAAGALPKKDDSAGVAEARCLHCSVEHGNERIGVGEGKREVGSSDASK